MLCGFRRQTAVTNVRMFNKGMEDDKKILTYFCCHSKSYR